MTKRRIFIAINLPDNLKKKLFDWQAKWPDLDYRLIRWTKKDNLHITLSFIGYVTDDETYEICNFVKKVAKKHEPFFVNLEKIILGPPDKNPRMFWVQGEKSQKLADIQSDLRDAIDQRTGVRYNAFRPHITLAKFKPGFMKTFPKDFQEDFKAQIPVETIEVMESALHRTGAEYTILESVELGE